jgi:hypothetical protein
MNIKMVEGKGDEKLKEEREEGKKTICHLSFRQQKVTGP